MFPAEVTDELKGLAIFAIVIAHIAFYLVRDVQFLAPLTYYAGIGVDIFLILSGFGLTMSALKKPLAPLTFYKKRLLRIYVPMWVALAVFFIADIFLKHIGYDPMTVVRSFIGFFPRADLYQDIDAPLWYFTFIVAYYLVFPLIFIKRAPWASALILFGLGYLVSYHVTLPVTLGIKALYRLHFVAFPLGVLGAWAVTQIEKQKLPTIPPPIRTLLMFVLLYVAYYFGIHSGVGKSIRTEQAISLVIATALILAFALKPVKLKLLKWWGEYSYETYLIHWPIMYRYDVLFAFLPPLFATVAYLCIFPLIAQGLRKARAVLYLRHGPLA